MPRTPTRVLQLLTTISMRLLYCTRSLSRIQSRKYHSDIECNFDDPPPIRFETGKTNTTYFYTGNPNSSTFCPPPPPPAATGTFPPGTPVGVEGIPVGASCK
mmetsp:Transcript_19624/g.31800  ORF Transcript_19624/g.31800 Transcript_19624/m.31800 type:complete len:102 (+) Transcript_19624:75-380(+)